MPQPPVIVINLDRSADRLVRIGAGLERAGLAYERLAAVDGAKALAEGGTGYDERRALRHMGRPLLPGEVGCYLSHLEAARRAAQSDAPFTVVLEDDAVVPEDLGATLDQLCRLLPGDIGIVNLGRKPRHRITQIDPNLGLVRAHYFPVTTTALMWRRETAQAFLESGPLLCHPVDVFLQMWATERGNGAAFLNPPLPPEDSESEIYAGRRSDQAKGLRYTALRLGRLLSNRINQRRT